MSRRTGFSTPSACRWTTIKRKAIKNAVPGATVNDAAITMSGRRCAKYLQAHGELPATLAAMAPVNVPLGQGDEPGATSSPA
ncbi:MAG: hypothetical protein IPG64_27095 [Haliea sp.]|nr:hypothetical protein [Haliea sp.]